MSAIPRTAVLTTPYVRQPMGRCICGDLVEQDELIAARHVAFVCRKATPEQKAAALALPGVAVEQRTPAQVAASEARKKEQRAAGRQRQLAKRRQRGRG